MACVDGGCEAQKILGMLDLPNKTTMEKKSFSGIERSIAPLIQSLTTDYLKESLCNEVRLMVADPQCDYTEKSYQLWKTALDNNTDLEQQHYPRLWTSMDMGWNGKGSGRAFDSSSGFASLIGMYSWKAIINDIKSRYCKICCLR